jgi:hypothetical protein
MAIMRWPGSGVGGSPFVVRALKRAVGQYRERSPVGVTCKPGCYNKPLVAQLKDKIENALNETRILVLGGQVLIGFNYESFF